MKTAELLHFACRARDPLALGRWYATLFEGQFLLHPVMSPLGIVIVKLNHPEMPFNELIEFWPWDLEWDGAATVFRKTAATASNVSYGHLALKLDVDTETICAELEKQQIDYRMEPRLPGVSIPVVDDPEGNMVELFPRIDNIVLPEDALCGPEQIDEALARLKRAFDEKISQAEPTDGIPLFLFAE